MGNGELTIFNTYDSFEADSVVALLREEEIPSYKREHGAGQYLSILFGTNTTQSIEIVIPEECEGRALEALEGAGFIEASEEDDDK